MAMKIRTSYYQQFDADFSLDVPAEGYGGWKTGEIDLDIERTALVVMHAWDTGTREQYPGLHRCVEYIPRADEIGRSVFPSLLATVRASKMKLFHVVGGGEYYKQYPGYMKAVELAGPDPSPPEIIQSDDSLAKLHKFKSEHVFVGKHNQEDARRGHENIDFMPKTQPAGDEGIAENSRQLFALCKDAGVNHLVYTGFAIDGCLLISPGGMLDMSRHGIMCSAIRQAVTAIENKETARDEQAKEIGLWRVALMFGFVFDVDEIMRALRAEGSSK